MQLQLKFSLSLTGRAHGVRFWPGTDHYSKAVRFKTFDSIKPDLPSLLHEWTVSSEQVLTCQQKDVAVNAIGAISDLCAVDLSNSCPGLTSPGDWDH